MTTARLARVSILCWPFSSARWQALRERLRELGVNSPFMADRLRIAERAPSPRLPMMTPAREYVEAGLVSYGTDYPDQFRRAAAYVDGFLRGARPADLPIEQPTKFELVMNVKTAKAFGLTIPQSVLGRADELIQ